ncbi:MAG: transcription elongation factor GreA [Chloroflexi bacterium]|nr:transcription elongation factor GreA [Chloroflexota bacterium]
MIEEDVVYLTAEGLQQINEELAYLKNVKRDELAGKLQAAIAQGDLKENADYHAAKEEQGFTEGRVRDLEDTLRRAEIIKENGPSDKVRVGSTVTVVEEGFDEEETYYIVGAHEADPTNGRISNESPIGHALLGAKKGQVVSAKTPGGQISFQIQSID